MQRFKRALHRAGTCWIAAASSTHLQSIRQHELAMALPLLPAGCRVLELGAGTGWQAKLLAEAGYQVSAIDIADSNYKEQRVWPVTDYDGMQVPFGDGEFDVVFSSNVLEHIHNRQRLDAELHRVLKPNGRCVHIVPSGSWSLWTVLTTLLKYWRPAEPHGEHAASASAEIRVFSQAAWRQSFIANGWDVVLHKPCRLAYSGCSIFDRRLALSVRKLLSHVLGSSTHLFVVTPAVAERDLVCGARESATMAP